MSGKDFVRSVRASASLRVIPTASKRVIGHGWRRADLRSTIRHSRVHMTWLTGEQIGQSTKGCHLFLAAADPLDPHAWHSARHAARIARRSDALTLLLAAMPFVGNTPTHVSGRADPEDADCVIHTEVADPLMGLALAAQALVLGMSPESMPGDFHDLRLVFESGRCGALIHQISSRQYSMRESVVGAFERFEIIYGLSRTVLAAAALSIEGSGYFNVGHLGDAFSAGDQAVTDATLLLSCAADGRMTRRPPAVVRLCCSHSGSGVSR